MLTKLSFVCEPAGTLNQHCTAVGVCLRIRRVQGLILVISGAFWLWAHSKWHTWVLGGSKAIRQVVGLTEGMAPLQLALVVKLGQPNIWIGLGRRNRQARNGLMVNRAQGESYSRIPQFRFVN